MIPNIFYQKWDRDIPSIVLENTLKNMPDGFEYKRYSFEDVETYLETRWGRGSLEAFRMYKKMAHKVDLWRYFMLYDTGGIYMDADCVLLSKIPDELILENDAVFVTNNRGVKNIFNGFIMIKPRHPIMRAMIDYMMSPEGIRHQKYYFFNCEYLYRAVMGHKCTILVDRRFGDGRFYIVYKNMPLLVESNELYPYK